MAEYSSIPRRSWTAAERRHVQRGFSGRVLIAIEPLLCTIAFIAFTVLPFFAPVSNDAILQREHRIQFTLAQVLAPIMALGALGFGAYTIAVIQKPLRALLSTGAPIYIVDGYLQYRTLFRSNGLRQTVVSVLNHNGACLTYWTTANLLAIADGRYPALVEFSRYGGILKIDGRPIDPPLFALAPYGIGTCNEHHPTAETRFN